MDAQPKDRLVLLTATEIENAAVAAYITVSDIADPTERGQAASSFRSAFRWHLECVEADKSEQRNSECDALRADSLKYRQVVFYDINGKGHKKWYRVHQRKPGTHTTLCGRHITAEEGWTDKKPRTEDIRGQGVNVCRKCKALGGLRDRESEVLLVRTTPLSDRRFELLRVSANAAR